VVRLDGLEPPT